MRAHRVRVAELPAWLDIARLLGEGAWSIARRDHCLEATAELSAHAAADLEARLRGLVIGGRRIAFLVEPRLPRALVRKARLDEARRLRQRSEGLSRAGVTLDEAARVGLTPERLALELGRHAKRTLEARDASRSKASHVVVDACCGAGGNAIGFARAGLHVVAIDLDPARVAAASHNARVYGVSDRIELLEGDARQLLAARSADLWFIDVPWAERDEAGQLPLLAELAALRPRDQLLWAKVPADYDPGHMPSARPAAWFGAAIGDARRVKFLLLEWGQ